MPKETTIYIAQSVDGYIATEDGSVKWLDDFQDSSYTGYDTFLSQIDTVIMGEKTYAQIKSFDCYWPYPKQHTYVFTHNKKYVDSESVSFSNSSVTALMGLLDEKNSWIVGGANIIAQFLEENLVDTLTISTIPIILGKGIRLFENTNTLTLKLIRSESYKMGMVENSYKILK